MRASLFKRVTFIAVPCICFISVTLGVILLSVSRFSSDRLSFFRLNRFMVSDRLEILISPYQRHVYWWQTYAFLFAFVRIYVLNYSTIYALTFSIYSITHAENNNKLLTCKHVYMLFVCVRFIFNSTVFFNLFSYSYAPTDTFF